MKKFFTKFVGRITHYGLLLTLALATLTNMQQLLGVTAAAYWVIMAIAIVIGPLIYFMSYVATKEKDADSRKKILEQLKEATKKKNTFLRSLGWIELIITSCLLAYAGWIVSSVFFILTSLWLRLFISLTRDKVVLIEAKDNVVGVD